MEHDELAEHELAIGATRPALMPYVGIPWPDFVVFLMAGVEALMFRWVLLIPIGLVLLFSLRLYRRDYNAGRCFICWLNTSGRHMAGNVFGGTFIRPRADRLTFRGIYHAV
jgi:type IV secretory pathway VirB3-like protein